MEKCIVRRITNLQTKLDPIKGKYFQTFIAGGLRLTTGNHYVEDQLGVVIPAGARVPNSILREMWLENKLAGAHRNKVRTKKMFGHLSEGIFYGQTWTNADGVTEKSSQWNDNWKEGDDVTAELGVTFPDV